MTTTSVPMMVSTKDPKTRVTTTVDNTVWITTATVPPIIAATGNTNTVCLSACLSLTHSLLLWPTAMVN